MYGVLVPILIGWVLGYVVNYLADVLPVARRFQRPTCPHCGSAYAVADYLALRRCRSCGRPRGRRTWIVLLAMTAFSAYVWHRPASGLPYALSLALATYFAVVLVIDLEHRLILHPVSAVGAAIGLAAGWALHGPAATVAGGLIGFMIMLALYGLGVVFSRYRARRLAAAGVPADNEEALGAGDVVLSAVLGLILGWPEVGRGLLLGILLGGVVAAILVASMLIARRYGRQALMVFMPYGPFFVASAFLLTFFPALVPGGPVG